ncbi:hypothetical protein, conserved [Trypanosoma cruzi]|uniref:PH domain-containing protein n=2 Tax=Trypanosoma cruzi TaxID=5693 RepID=Q4DFH9_TRYCC|nr:hypothetical protein, conserved [Trypanosoma cruzi]EAN91285.1 hypothetical protein, conserved [Trypanosoma cruzi]|eukprot:XP_813136.1 hypothetical protein [Trypanosoma cruzi strain CL Brener]
MHTHKEEECAGGAMDWRHASMSGSLTWVKGTTVASSPTPSVLYSELSPTLIVGLTLRGGAPADYIKFSTVTSVMHMAPHTVKLHLGEAAQVSLIAPDSRECLQWLDAIQLALSGKKGNFSSTEKLSSVIMTRSSPEPSVYISENGTSGLSEWGGKKDVLHKNDENHTGSAEEMLGNNGHHDPLSNETTNNKDAEVIEGIVVREGNDGTKKLQSMATSLNFARPTQLSMVHNGETERNLLTHLNENDAFLPISPHINEVAAVSETSEPKIRLPEPDVDTIKEMRKGPTLYSGTMSKGEQIPSALDNEPQHVIVPSSPYDVSSTAALGGIETRLPSISVASEDRSVMEHERLHKADFLPRELPQESSLADAAEKGLFGRFMPVEEDHSFCAEVALSDGRQELSYKEDAVSQTYVETNSRNSPVRRPVMAPAPNELLSSNHEMPVLFSEGSKNRAYRYDCFFEMKPTNSDADAARRGEMSIEKGVEVKCRDLVAHTNRCHTDETLFQPSWRLPGNSGLPLESQNRSKLSSLEQSHGGSRRQRSHQRKLAESIIDRIIHLSSSDASHENPSSVVLSAGIDTPSVLFPSRAKDGYYRPIEAAVAVTPRRSASGARSVLGRSISVESPGPINVNDRNGARDVLPLKLASVRNSVDSAYAGMNRGVSPHIVKEHVRELDSVIHSPAYRHSTGRNFYYKDARFSSLSNEEFFRNERPTNRLRRGSSFGASSREWNAVSKRKKLRRKVKGGNSPSAGEFLMEPTLFTKHAVQGHGGSKHYACVTEDGAYFVCIPAQEFEMRYSTRQRGLSTLEEVMGVYGEGCRAMALSSIDHVSMGTEEKWTHALQLQGAFLDRLVCVVSCSHAFLLEASTAAEANMVVEAWNAFLLEYT